MSMKNLLKKIIYFFTGAPKNYLIGDKSVIYLGANIFNSYKTPDKIKVGDFTHIRGDLLIFGHGGMIEIGDYCYIGENTKIWSGLSIKIGSRVLISHNCNIFDNDTHPLDHAARHEQFKAIISAGHPAIIDLKDEPVALGDDVLIGANSTILKGVSIGARSIIGAGSVVTANIPPDVVAAGNPAKVIKNLRQDRV